MRHWNDYNYAYKVMGIDTERDTEVFVIALGESMGEAVKVAKAYYGESFVVQSAIYLGSVVLPGVARDFQQAFDNGRDVGGRTAGYGELGY